MGNDGDILFLNIQSLRNHHDQLKFLVASLKWQPSVVALCDTWLSDNDPLELFNLDGYQKGIFVNRQKSRGWGLAFFIKDQIDFFIKDQIDQIDCLYDVSTTINQFKAFLNAIYEFRYSGRVTQFSSN